ncbi:baseplate J/gp47 family protein [Rhodoferax sp. BLA1]|uniref:baseplate J/gp47 family protein n=1 Tax=Rhodoferax sp. BLA1 TaxID=2576062 RepID=UPI0015D41B5D|nr:baseplate J/gp47 family protein [Rhodoferax sp. BLA1]
MDTYTRPTYEQLRDRISADLAAMPAVLRGPLSAAWARACHGEHGHLDWLHAQCSPLTCDEERLADWAVLYGVARLAATYSVGPVDFGGSAGATLLTGAAARGANGLDYVVVTAVTLTGATDVAQVQCTTAGAVGNLPAGAVLTLIDPLSSVDSDLVVGAAGLSGGAAQELVEDWRARVVEEWQTVTTDGARGGRKADYVYWAKAAHPSVTGALVQLHALGVGTVLVRPICNGLSQRLPTPAVVAAVLNKLLALAPAMPDKSVEVPDLVPVTVQIDLLPGVDTGPNRAAILAALVALVDAEQSEGAVLQVAEIDAAIAVVTTQYTRLAPMADLVCGAGQVFAPPTVVWA